jgi:hypothetical protein
MVRRPVENDKIIEAAAQALMIRAQQRDAPLPTMYEPEDYPEASIEVTYYEGYRVGVCPTDDDAAQVEVTDRAGGEANVLADEVVRGYDSAESLATLIEDIYRRALLA